MLTTLLSYIIPILVIVDPIGNIPVFLAMTEENTTQERYRIVFKACMAGFITLTVFTLVGNLVLDLFNISVPAFEIASGIILASISMDMLRAQRVKSRTSHAEEKEGAAKDDVSLFPLAIPMLSGPGAFTTVIALAARQGSIYLSKLYIIIGTLVTFVITYIVLRYSLWLMARMGTTGINITQRIMGLILLIISVQFMINGVLALFPG